MGCRVIEFRSTGLALFVAVLLSGCATLGAKLESPTLSLVQIRLVEAGLAQQRYTVTVNVANPNALRLPVGGVTYAIDLAGTRFASGTTPRSFSVPARGETQFDIDVSTNLIATAQRLASFLGSGAQQLDYSMSGTVDVDLPFVDPLPFERAGAISLTPE